MGLFEGLFDHQAGYPGAFGGNLHPMIASISSNAIGISARPDSLKNVFSGSYLDLANRSPFCCSHEPPYSNTVALASGLESSPGRDRRLARRLARGATPDRRCGVALAPGGVRRNAAAVLSAVTHQRRRRSNRADLA